MPDEARAALWRTVGDRIFHPQTLAHNNPRRHFSDTAPGMIPDRRRRTWIMKISDGLCIPWRLLRSARLPLILRCGIFCRRHCLFCLRILFQRRLHRYAAQCHGFLRNLTKRLRSLSFAFSPALPDGGYMRFFRLLSSRYAHFSHTFRQPSETRITRCAQR